MWGQSLLIPMTLRTKLGLAHTLYTGNTPIALTGIKATRKGEPCPTETEQPC